MIGSVVTGSPKNGLRERKKRRTRDELETVALRLFEQHGFDAVTVEDIAAEAEVSPRTFFRYYPSKEDVLFADVEQKMGALHAELKSSPSSEPVLETMRRVIMTLAVDFESVSLSHRYRTLIQIVERSPHLAPRLLGRMAAQQEEMAAVIAGRRGTEPGSDLYSHLMAACAVDALRISLEIRERSSPPRPAADIVGEAFDLLAKGFG
jgi:AcrR family transcriptional regulator